MRRFLHVFRLTKSEQRIIVLVLLVLTAGAVMREYRQVHQSAVPFASIAPSPRTSLDPLQEDEP